MARLRSPVWYEFENGVCDGWVPGQWMYASMGRHWMPQSNATHPASRALPDGTVEIRGSFQPRPGRCPQRSIAFTLHEDARPKVMVTVPTRRDLKLEVLTDGKVIVTFAEPDTKRRAIHL